MVIDERTRGFKNADDDLLEIYGKDAWMRRDGGERGQDGSSYARNGGFNIYGAGQALGDPSGTRSDC